MNNHENNHLFRVFVYLFLLKLIEGLACDGAHHKNLIYNEIVCKYL